ncbi:MAG TPA: GxxExxY protein [Mariprofundaceae bacterium]|nr:GxxExxY protein [Mariprofundaceae bacterium]
MNHRDAEAQRDALTENVIGAAIEVHKQLGPGLLESAYQICLCHELKLKNIGYKSEVSLPVEYKGIKLDCGYRMDLVVENQLIVELKTAERILPVHEAQLLTYMKLSNIGKGLLLNFHTPVLKQGIKRMVL